MSSPYYERIEATYCALETVESQILALGRAERKRSVAWQETKKP